MFSMSSTKSNTKSRDYFILLKEYPNAQTKTRLSLLPKSDNTTALKGSLWFSTKIETDKARISLESIEDPNTTLVCGLSDVSKLSFEEYQLLLAVQSCKDRHNLYQQKAKLAKAAYIYQTSDNGTLKSAVQVDYVEFGEIRDSKAGLLVYVGKIKDRSGFWLIIKINKEKSPSGQSGYMDMTVKEPSSYDSVKVPLTQVNFKDTDSNESVAIEKLLEIGDRVIWINNEDKPEYAVVKWSGIIDDFPDQYTYGVEFDNPVGAGAGHFRGRHLFNAKMNHASLIPAMGLIKAEVFDSYSGGASSRAPRPKELCLEATPALPPFKASPKAVHAFNKRSLSQSLCPKKLSLNIYDNQEGSCTTYSLSSGITQSSSYPIQPYSKKSPNPNALERDLSKEISLACSTRNIDVGSMVQVDIPGSSSHQFGVVRWIGPIYNEIIAGIELEEECSAATDGCFDGNQLFTCPPKKGYFAKLSKIKKDERFSDLSLIQSFGCTDCFEIAEPQSCKFADNESSLLDLLSGGVAKQFTSPHEQSIPHDIGRNLGIQGHHNSCYLDATLFSMFAFNSCFDSLLYRQKNKDDISQYSEIQSTLFKEVVNPLRSNYYVRADKVLKLRHLIELTSPIRGFLCEEKDPEEFLHWLFVEALKTEPFLKFESSHESNHPETTGHSLQLLVEGASTSIPTTQQLLELTLNRQNLKLLESPSCLILQLPRFGKEKVFQKIIPSLILNIENFLVKTVCKLCREIAHHQCDECVAEFGRHSKFCDDCLNKIHSKTVRADHKPHLIGNKRLVSPLVANDSSEKNIKTTIQTGDCQSSGDPSSELSSRQPSKKQLKISPPTAGQSETLELFALICIRTSHYVSFSKCGYQRDSPWVFFDSMADRIGLDNGYNVPKITPCKYIVKHILDPKDIKVIKNSPTEKLPEEVKRFICDGYICMYRNLRLLNYK